jgi:hypothetical protein
MLRLFLASKDMHNRSSAEDLSVLLNNMFLSVMPRIGGTGGFTNIIVADYTSSMDQSDLVSVYKKIKSWVYFLAQKHHPGNDKIVMKHHLNLKNIAAMAEVFPDAIFVNIVRDPKEWIPSLCSLIHAWTNSYLRNPSENKMQIGKAIHTAELWSG